MVLLASPGDRIVTSDPDDLTRLASSFVTTTAILLALVKVRFIFREFMEVRNAPALLCRLTDLWVVLIGAALLGSYFIGLAAH